MGYKKHAGAEHHSLRRSLFLISRSIEDLQELEFSMKSKYAVILLLWFLCHISMANGKECPEGRRIPGDPCSTGTQCCSKNCQGTVGNGKCKSVTVGHGDSGKVA